MDKSLFASGTPTKTPHKAVEQAKSAAHAKVTPNPTQSTPKTKKPVASLTGTKTKYKMGDTKYNPRVEHTKDSWDKVVRQITIKGKGCATGYELASVLKEHLTKVGEDHLDFVAYLLRRGAIKVAK